MTLNPHITWSPGRIKVAILSVSAMRKLNIQPIAECSHDPIFIYFIWRDLGKFCLYSFVPFCLAASLLKCSSLLCVCVCVCVCVFPLLLKGLLSEPLKILSQHWKRLTELSTALLTEGIKKINCCGLQEIKLYVSVEGEWPMEGIWNTPGEPAAFLGTWSNSHHTSFPFGRVLFFYPYSSLKMLLT